MEGDGSCSFRKGVACRSSLILLSRSEDLPGMRLCWPRSSERCSLHQPIEGPRRNHQVGLMKHIYANAGEVYVWLGREANDSDVAVDFVSKREPRI